MRENKRTWLTLILVLSVSLLIVAAVIYYTVATNEKYKDQRYELYFLTSSEPQEIDSEARYFFPDSNEELPRELIQALLSGPESYHLVSPFPEDLRLLSASLAGNTLSVVFSEHYDNLDAYERNLADCCLYRTVSAIPEIHKVFLRVTGSKNAPSLLSADRFLTNDRFFVTANREFMLYYPNTSLTALQSVRYPHLMYFDQSEVETVLDLLEHKIFPQQDYAPLPSPLVNDTLAYDRVAYVDLSADLLIIHEDIDAYEYEDRIRQNSIYLQALVTTLTSLDDIDSVMFTFDDTVMGVYGDLDLSKPLTVYHFQ